MWEIDTETERERERGEYVGKTWTISEASWPCSWTFKLFAKCVLCYLWRNCLKDIAQFFLWSFGPSSVSKEIKEMHNFKVSNKQQKIESLQFFVSLRGELYFKIHHTLVEIYTSSTSLLPFHICRVFPSILNWLFIAKCYKDGIFFLDAFFFLSLSLQSTGNYDNCGKYKLL